MMRRVNQQVRYLATAKCRKGTLDGSILLGTGQIKDTYPSLPQGGFHVARYSLKLGRVGRKERLRLGERFRLSPNDQFFGLCCSRHSHLQIHYTHIFVRHETLDIISLSRAVVPPSEPEFQEVAGAVGVRFLPSGHVAPLHVAHDLSERQRQ